jgi:glycine oxidase
MPAEAIELSEQSGSQSFDVAFVGGGVIGLASAWRAAQAGARVVVLERAEPPAGATDVAAGMLAPVGELSFGEPELLALMLASRELWPGFAAEVEAASGLETSFREDGALHVAIDRDEAGELRRRNELQGELGLDAEWLTPRRCRELEPALTTTFVGGVLARGDASVDPRRLALALAAALREAGGELRTGTEVVDGLWEGERLVGVRTAPTGTAAPGPAAPGATGDTSSASAAPTTTLGAEVRADTVVLCNGAWSGQAPWLPPEARPPVRPVKGEVIELRPREGEPVPAERIVCTERVYIVPRPDGRLVIGATQEERGFDTVVTAGGVHELLREAYRVIPEVAEMELIGMTAGLRPGTPDNLPIVGPGAVDGLLLATGHFRNGIMLTPVTADAVAAMLTGGEPPAAIAPADPRRSSLVPNTGTYDERPAVGATR